MRMAAGGDTEAMTSSIMCGPRAWHLMPPCKLCHLVSSTGKRVNPADRTYYPNFDWLRLLLAVQVVAIHCGLGTHVLIAPVPAFLAISGFVVLGSIERRSIKDFYISRALRVLPLLFASFIAVGILYGGEAMLYNIEYWLYPHGAVPANPVVWTLFLEEVFYILLSILFCVGVYKKEWLVVSLLIVVGSFTAARCYEVLAAAYYVLGSAFFAGNVVYLFRDQVRRIDRRVACALIAVSCISISVLPYMDMQTMPYMWAHILSFGCLLIFAIAGPQLPRLRIDLSYSIYLIHAIVANQYHKFIPFGFELFALVLLTSLPICIACWYLIESPALALKRRLTVPRPVPLGVAQNAPL
jgi:peptidoglycan/LPS O-acetylase OafA/YrhL